MQRFTFGKIRVCIVTLFLLLAPVMVHAQVRPGAPPVGQPLTSEGDFAVDLGAALGVVTTNDEVEAESQLSELGIMPRNGWIADYPVTPDIIIELQKAVGDAVSSGSLSMSRDEALKKLDDVVAGFGLSVRPHTGATAYEPTAASCENYPNPASIYNSYASEGEPLVTYYCPPPEYYSLYAWVPCPFWWGDLWFAGFFILHDFHKVIHVHRKVVAITNHFNDVKTHRAFRVDPVARFRGRTFAGIGVSHSRGFISTGVPRSAETIFNAPRAQKVPGGSMATPVPRGGERASPEPRGGERVSPAGGGGGVIQRGPRR